MCSLTLKNSYLKRKTHFGENMVTHVGRKIQRLTFEKSAHIGRKNSHWTKYGFTHIEEICQLTLERAKLPWHIDLCIFFVSSNFYLFDFVFCPDVMIIMIIIYHLSNCCFKLGTSSSLPRLLVAKGFAPLPNWKQWEYWLNFLILCKNIFF